MSADILLNRLDKVRKTGRDTWRACCPAHRGANPNSLSIRQLENGGTLLYCHAHQCQPADIAAAVGLNLDALFPEKTSHRGKSERRPFFSHEMFKAAITEVRLVYLAALNISKGRAISPEEMQRLTVAIERIHNAYNMGGGAA